jgi:hypothetical protein
MWEVAKTRIDAEKEFDRTVQYIRDTIDALKELDRTSSRFVIQDRDQPGRRHPQETAPATAPPALRPRPRRQEPGGLLNPHPGGDQGDGGEQGHPVGHRAGAPINLHLDGFHSLNRLHHRYFRDLLS